MLSKKRSMACCPSVRPCSKDISSSKESVPSFLDFDLLILNVLSDFLLGLLLFVTASSSSRASRASSNTCKIYLKCQRIFALRSYRTCFSIKKKQELKNYFIFGYLDGPKIYLPDRG